MRALRWPGSGLAPDEGEDEIPELLRGWPSELRTHMGANAFVVLELDFRATRSEVETRAQALLDALELEVAGAEVCAAPWGRHPRDAVDVRHALHRLRDPQTRALEELDRLYLDELMAAATALIG